MTSLSDLDAGLPANIDAEKTILGAVLLDESYWSEIEEKLAPDDFSLDAHKRIGSAMKRLRESGSAIDIVTLANQLASAKSLEHVGGIAYLASLTEGLPLRPQIDAYIRILKDKSVLRRMMLTCSNVIARAADQGESPLEILADLTNEVEALSEPSRDSAVGHVSKFLPEAVINFNREFREKITPCIPSGIDWFDAKAGGYRLGRITLVCARPNVGKSLPLDTPIWMKDGSTKPMGEIRVGDGLASPDSVSSSVLAVYPQGELESFRVTFWDGRSLRASADHLWRVHCRHWDKDGRLLTTAQIAERLARKRYRNRMWIDTPTGEYGVPRALPIDPWLLGLLLGDGHLNDCSFSTKDTEILKRVEWQVGKFGLRCKHHGPGCDYRIANDAEGRGMQWRTSQQNSIKQTLRDLGLIEKRSYQKFIPPIYLQASREQRLELLRGLMDSDGHATINGSIEFCTVSPILARQVRSLVRSLGALCRIKFVHPKGGRRAFRLFIRHRDRAQFFWLERKRAHAAKFSRQPRLNISAVTTESPAQMQCIAVSHPSKLYIAGDSILTHNTPWALQSLAYHCKRGKRAVFFSLEQDKEEVLRNLLPYVTELPNRVCSRPELQTPEQNAIAAAGWETLLDWDLHIYDGEMDADRICWVMDREAKTADELLGAIDHFGKMAIGPVTKGDTRSRYNENSEKLRKKMKRLPNAALLELCQLRKVNREFWNKAPIPDDIKESGNLYEDAYACILLHRPVDEESQKMSRETQINLCKLRAGGSTGMTKGRFETRRLSFVTQAELELHDDPDENYIAN